MKIIRDDEGHGLFMIPLFVEWGIKRCNVKGCTAKPNTIITQLGDGISPAGLCEEHFQQGNVPGGAILEFVWDGFDAFAQAEVTA